MFGGIFSQNIGILIDCHVLFFVYIVATSNIGNSVYCSIIFLLFWNSKKISKKSTLNDSSYITLK